MTDVDTPKRKGRPPKPAAERKDGNLTFRTRGQTRAQLAEAAEASGRSISEEIERRIDASFNKDLAKLREYMFGDAVTEKLLNNIVLISRLIENWNSEVKGNNPCAWHESDITKAAMRKAVQHIIFAATPHILDPLPEAADPLETYLAGTQSDQVNNPLIPRPIGEAQDYGLFIARAVTGTPGPQISTNDDDDRPVNNLGLGT